MRRLLGLLFSLIALQSSGQIFKERVFHQFGSELPAFTRISGNSLYVSYLTGSPVFNSSYILKTDLEYNYLDSSYIRFDHGKEGGIGSLNLMGDSLIISGATRFNDFYGSYFKNEFLIFDTAFNEVLRKVLPLDSIPLWDVTPLSSGKFLLQGGSHSSPPNLYIGICDKQGNVEKDTVYKEFYDIPWLSNIQPLANGKLFCYSGFKFRLEIDPSNLALSVTDTSVQNARGKILAHPNGFYYHTTSFLSLSLGKLRDGVFVRKIDSNGVVVDSVSVYNDRDNPVTFGYDASCILNNGNIVLAYAQDSTINGTIFRNQKLVVLSFDDQLNLLWRKESYQTPVNLLPYSAVATPDGGAIILGSIDDTISYVNGQVDVYYLRIDSTGYFSPLSAKEFDGMVSTAKSIFPNPVSTSFTIEGLIDNETYQVGIYDLRGNLMKRLKLEYPFQMDATELEKGAYLLILQDAGGLQTTRKFVKE